MLKRILTILVFVAALAASALFTSLNPVAIHLDLGFASFQTPLGLAIVLAVAVGWLLGLVSALGWVIRLLSERRRLRSQLRDRPAASVPVTDERN